MCKVVCLRAGMECATADWGQHTRVCKELAYSALCKVAGEWGGVPGLSGALEHDFYVRLDIRGDESHLLWTARELQRLIKLTTNVVKGNHEEEVYPVHLLALAAHGAAAYTAHDKKEMRAARNKLYHVLQEEIYPQHHAYAVLIAVTPMATCHAVLMKPVSPWPSGGRCWTCLRRGSILTRKCSRFPAHHQTTESIRIGKRGVPCDNMIELQAHKNLDPGYAAFEGCSSWICLLLLCVVTGGSCSSRPWASGCCRPGKHPTSRMQSGCVSRSTVRTSGGGTIQPKGLW